MKNCIVCGSRFGQFYLEALKCIPNVNIIGILANGSERSIACANYYNVNLYKSVEELPENIDFACVAIKSEVQGGQGNLIAERMLEKGIDVIFEQPISEKEYAFLFSLDNKEQRYFAICNLYSHLPSVKNLIENYRMIKKEQKVKYINIDFATQLSFPVAQILSKLLPESVNAHFTMLEQNAGPYQFATAIIKGIQLNLNAHNIVVEQEKERFMKILFSIKIGFEGGELNLVDPHGFAYWRPFIYFPDRYNIPSSLYDKPPTGMTYQYILSTYDEPEFTQQSIFTELWPRIIAEEINIYLEINQSDLHHFNTIAQSQINTALIWKKIMQSFGYPLLVAIDCYKVFDVKHLVQHHSKNENTIDCMTRLENVCAQSMLYVLCLHLDR